MPHFPYFYSADGSANPDEKVFGDSMITGKTDFAGYILYQSKIGGNSEPPDRKYRRACCYYCSKRSRHHRYSRFKKGRCLSQFLCIYFPDKDYHRLYEGMSNVNSFRVVLDQYFGQSLPLLPDHSIFSNSACCLFPDYYRLFLSPMFAPQKYW